MTATQKIVVKVDAISIALPVALSGLGGRLNVSVYVHVKCVL